MKNGNSVKVPLLQKAVWIIEKYKNDVGCQVTGTLLLKYLTEKSINI